MTRKEHLFQGITLDLEGENSLKLHGKAWSCRRERTRLPAPRRRPREAARGRPLPWVPPPQSPPHRITGHPEGRLPPPRARSQPQQPPCAARFGRGRDTTAPRGGTGLGRAPARRGRERKVRPVGPKPRPGHDRIWSRPEADRGRIRASGRNAHGGVWSLGCREGAAARVRLLQAAPALPQPGQPVSRYLLPNRASLKSLKS